MITPKRTRSGLLLANAGMISPSLPRERFCQGLGEAIPKGFSKVVASFPFEAIADRHSEKCVRQLLRNPEDHLPHSNLEHWRCSVLLTSLITGALRLSLAPRLRQTNFCRRAQKRGNTFFLAKNSARSVQESTAKSVKVRCSGNAGKQRLSNGTCATLSSR